MNSSCSRTTRSRRSHSFRTARSRRTGCDFERFRPCRAAHASVTAAEHLPLFHKSSAAQPLPITSHAHPCGSHARQACKGLYSYSYTFVSYMSPHSFPPSCVRSRRPPAGTFVCPRLSLCLAVLLLLTLLSASAPAHLSLRLSSRAAWTGWARRWSQMR